MKNAILLLELGLCLATALSRPVCGQSPETDHEQANGSIFHVSAGEYDHPAQLPIRAAIPDPLAEEKQFSLYALDCQADQSGEPKSIDVQRLDNDFIFLLESPLKAGKSRTYRIAAAKQQDQEQDGVRFDNDGKSITASIGEKRVFQYAIAMREPPEGIGQVYRRNGYVHPIYDPLGREVTGDFAADHPHQHGMFFAWVDTIHNTNKVDFWNQKGKTGAIQFADNATMQSGSVCGELRTTQQHLDITDASQPVTVISEDWQLTVYAITDLFVIDFASKQTLVSAHPLLLRRYHYGGFALRGNDQWLHPQDADAKKLGTQPPDAAADFLTSLGGDRIAGNHTRPNWTSMFGKIDGKFSSISVLDHSTNLRHPQPVRLHPTKPYFCQAPEVLGGFLLNRDEPLISRYRLIISANHPEVELLNTWWRSYTMPPGVMWATNK